MISNQILQSTIEGIKNISRVELGDKKELVTQEDLPYIVSDVLKHGVVAPVKTCGLLRQHCKLAQQRVSVTIDGDNRVIIE